MAARTPPAGVRVVCHPSRGGVIKSEEFASREDVSHDDCLAFLKALADLGGGVLTVMRGDELLYSIDV